VVDLSALIRPLSQLDDHSSAPPASAPPFLLGGHHQLALENLAMRQQLAVYKRTATRPPLRRVDRLFWIGLARVWAGWRQPLVIVTPDTVLRWQRRRFREYWTKLSGRPTGGRPSVNAEIKILVTRVVAANPLETVMTDEHLNVELFFSIADPQQKILEWQRDYNEPRPHSSLGNICPREFVAQCRSGVTALNFVARCHEIPGSKTSFVAAPRNSAASGSPVFAPDIGPTPSEILAARSSMTSENGRLTSDGISSRRAGTRPWPS
jgi:hypothetical protein